MGRGSDPCHSSCIPGRGSPVQARRYTHIAECTWGEAPGWHLTSSPCDMPNLTCGWQRRLAPPRAMKVPLVLPRSVRNHACPAPVSSSSACFFEIQPLDKRSAGGPSLSVPSPSRAELEEGAPAAARATRLAPVGSQPRRERATLQALYQFHHKSPILSWRNSEGGWGGGGGYRRTNIQRQYSAFAALNC